MVFFATLTAFGLKASDVSPNLPRVEIIWAIGLGVALLCILTPALLSKPWVTSLAGGFRWRFWLLASGSGACL